MRVQVCARGRTRMREKQEQTDLFGFDRVLKTSPRGETEPLARGMAYPDTCLLYTLLVPTRVRAFKHLYQTPVYSRTPLATMTACHTSARAFTLARWVHTASILLVIKI